MDPAPADPRMPRRLHARRRDRADARGAHRRGAPRPDPLACSRPSAGGPPLSQPAGRGPPGERHPGARGAQALGRSGARGAIAPARRQRRAPLGGRPRRAHRRAVGARSTGDPSERGRARGGQPRATAPKPGDLRARHRARGHRRVPRGRRRVSPTAGCEQREPDGWRDCTTRCSARRRSSRSRILAILDAMRESLEDHLGLIGELARGDLASSEKAIELHWQRSHERLRRKYREFIGAPGGPVRGATPAREGPVDIPEGHRLVPSRRRRRGPRRSRAAPDL